MSNDGTSEIKNCYYAGTIRIEMINEYVKAYALIAVNSGKITNCHCLIQEDSMTQSGIGGNNNPFVEIYSYNSIEKMYELSRILNAGQDGIWINVPNRTPQLGFYSNKKN